MSKMGGKKDSRVRRGEEVKGKDYTPLAVVSRARKVSTLSTTAPNGANFDVSWKDGAVIGAGSARETFIGVITDIRHRNK
jgi:hypothetical protein